MAEPLLRASDLRKSYTIRRGSQRGTKALAVDGVSINVATGSCVAIVGESGSGKTTVGRLIVGLEQATSGTIEFRGEARRVPRRLEERRAFARQIQMVFQDPYTSLDPRQTGERCLDETLRVHTRLDKAARRLRVRELGEQVGLGLKDMEVAPHQLSGGQRQRLAIARSLAVSPSILVLDEAVSALDVSVQAQILNLLVSIRRGADLAYVFISHDLAVVRQLADQVLVMQNGRVVESGSTDQVLDTPQHEYTRLLRDSVPRKGWTPARRLPPPESG